MKKKKLQCSVPTLLLAGVLCLTLAACGAKQSSDMLASDTDSAASAALPVKAMNAKRVDENPYMAKSDANIHHDGYNTDSTDEVLPLGIYPEINVSYEKTNANASPAIYFDSYGHAVVPLLGGIAIRDLNAEETTTLGYFSPKQHDGGGYVIQSSYTFLDSENRIVCPTSNNHVLMLRATDEAGNVLPEFEKVLDIDIKAAAEAALGKELTQNLLSVVFDYDGNLWFATGGFRIYPEREQQGRARLHHPLGDRGDPERRAGRPFEGRLRLRAGARRGRGKRDCRLQGRRGHPDKSELLSAACQ